MNYPLMLAACSLPLAGAAFAEAPVTSLEPVVVTATRTPQADSLASVTVIDRAEIDRSQARSLPGLLQGLPGITVSRNGGAGQSASIFLRGTNSDHVLVLVDGIKIGSSTAGQTPFEDLPLEEIERIEIVRGPRSSLYGSEAIGGVIQIFTRRGGGALRPRLRVGAGSHGSAEVAAGMSGGGEQAWWSAGASLSHTDGINACDGRASPFAGCGVVQPDRDAYRNVGISLRGGYAFSDAAKLDVHLLRSENRTDFDGSEYAGNLSRAEQQVLGTTAVLQPLAPWTLTLTAGRSWDKYRSYFEDPDTGMEARFVDSFNTERDTLSLQNDLTIGVPHLLTLGLDYQEDRVGGTLEYTEDSRDNLGVFGQYQGYLGATDLELSLRQDDNQQFGGHTTGSAAIGYLIGQETRVSLSYGTAFKAPTFNDLYYPNYGSLDLDPEQSESLELGLTGILPLGQHASGDWDVHLYETRINDLIAYDAAASAVANVQKALIRGLEASSTIRYAAWVIQANATLLDPENRSKGPNEGNLLPRRPQQSVRLDVDRQLARWAAGATLYVAGRSFDDLANRDRLDGYALVDLRAEYELTDALKLQARVENLLDQDYETAYLYNRPGRSFYLTLSYQPGSGY
ncbi:TonB-dependent vitamin B12 receptor [Thiorhodococcus mannitoliphagus]|uniref:TonB-dependent vitamin B12 receptor n=1 Tax=Thiorhodococcus mannitoliphagus TaxID=329406 RepID=A0A6P1DU79_9GAMM|nr:TonB-dependent vitamin B12 receptor [Thiorhodococcus mannitoliphagus]NEX19602.1 TonB-dependent vitamin B12 receptor [Thiorhodococcus mannitoliphagus]